MEKEWQKQDGFLVDGYLFDDLLLGAMDSMDHALIVAAFAKAGLLALG